MEETARRDAEAIFRAAVGEVEPTALVRRAVVLEPDGVLTLRAAGQTARYDLRHYDRVLVAGLGKAGASMAAGLEAALGSRLDGGVAVVKDGHGAALERVRILEAAHPVPDGRSEAAAQALLTLGAPLTERDLVIALISGGGSALACAPAHGLSLADKSLTTQALLASGATIHEMNGLRKHLSAVKGGRLAAAWFPATVVALVLSDVVGDDLDTIASGPTVPDPTTWADVQATISRRGLADRLSATVLTAVRRGVTGELEETPKPGDPRFARVRTFLLGTNRLALHAAEAHARELGYHTLILTSRLTGEAREAALFLHAVGQDIALADTPISRPACLLAGGETTVHVRGAGKGGRNQEMALAFLAALSASPAGAADMLFLSGGTDGTDGPTDAAGAFAFADLLAQAQKAGLESEAALTENDSYTFFDRLGGLLRTGATRTNVGDVQVLLVR